MAYVCVEVDYGNHKSSAIIINDDDAMTKYCTDMLEEYYQTYFRDQYFEEQWRKTKKTKMSVDNEKIDIMVKDTMQKIKQLTLEELIKKALEIGKITIEEDGYGLKYVVKGENLTKC